MENYYGGVRKEEKLQDGRMDRIRNRELRYCKHTDLDDGVFCILAFVFQNSQVGRFLFPMSLNS
jgi:hypothetical protein